MQAPGSYQVGESDMGLLLAITEGAFRHYPWGVEAYFRL